MNFISRRSFIKFTAGTTGLAFSYGLSRESSPENRPNILWLTTEDLSPFLGCYGDSTADTPNLDKLASLSTRYENAFANVPVCAPARFTLATGMYATSVGSQHMRSRYPRPKKVLFYSEYLRKAGYYCTNCKKTDYNTAGDWSKPWDQCGRKAHYKHGKKGQPFFAVFNLTTTHESCMHPDNRKTTCDPGKVKLPPYHPDLKDIRQDWAEFYGSIQTMDRQAGRILAELDKSGLAEETIVFFYGDHGGILPRSKRFCYDTGTRVPLLIRFPKKYRHLAPTGPGQKTDRLVSFVDFAPTVLSLAGVEIPGHMQGLPFLGKRKIEPRKYVHLFRGRMDERYDMVRAVRDKQYLYIRNYMPHRISGQHVEYLWRAQSTRAWEKAFKDGKCNETQSRFWHKKAPEELYDTRTDPWTIKNLAVDKTKADILKRLRKANIEHLKSIRDTGFVPEGEMVRLAEAADITLHELVHDESFPFDDIIETAEMATSHDPSCLDMLKERMKHKNSAVRYWAATGCICLGKKAAGAAEGLQGLLEDESPDVRIAAGEALCMMGMKNAGLPAILQVLEKTPVDKAKLHAVNSLQSMEISDKAAVEAVASVVKDGEKYVKQAGNYYLKCFN